MPDLSRLWEAACVLLVALAATAARVSFGIVHQGDFPPVDVEGARLWRLRYKWAVIGEIAAVLTFVMVAEAIVMLKDLPGPVGVLMGAGAAVLGYPMLAGLFRRKVEQRYQEGQLP